MIGLEGDCKARCSNFATLSKIPPLILLEDLLLLFSLLCIPLPLSNPEKSRNADGVRLPSENRLEVVVLIGPLYVY